MREKLRLDAYNVIIIALIPFVLLVAWGLTWGYERDLRAKQCDDAVAYLEDVAGFSSLYTNAGSLDGTSQWLSRMQDLDAPEPLEDLQNGAIAALTWASRTNLDVPTDQPGALYDQLTTFKRVLDDGRAKLAKQCPDADALVPAAFPMYFREDGA